MDEVIDNIKNEISENDVVLFMKGTSSMPQCGFSSRIAGVLNYLEVKYRDVNVLADDNLREEINSDQKELF
jgi:monothiol glutaredoxin